MEKLLPIIIMLESFGAGIVYLYYKDYGRCVYWIAAGVLNLAVVYLIH